MFDFSLTFISRFFAHFGHISKRLSNFKHSYHSQMTTKNDNQYIKIEVSSLVIQQYFNVENSSFVMHFTVDQTGVLFGGHPVERQNKVSKKSTFSKLPRGR